MSKWVMWTIHYSVHKRYGPVSKLHCSSQSLTFFSDKTDSLMLQTHQECSRARASWDGGRGWFADRSSGCTSDTWRVSPCCGCCERGVEGWMRCWMSGHSIYTCQRRTEGHEWGFTYAARWLREQGLLLDHRRKHSIIIHLYRILKIFQ